MKHTESDRHLQAVPADLGCAPQKANPPLTPLNGALEMAALGLPVFPLKAGTKDGHLSKSWKASATVDVGRIRAIGARFPGCNWGARCAGHLVLDIDTADGKPGEASFLALELAHDLPRTRTHNSARGGSHVILSLPPGVEVSNRDAPLGPGVNVRGAGGYVMCPGSTFDGKPYTVGDAAPVALAPATLVELLRAPAAVKGVALPVEHEDNPAAVASAVSWLERRPPAVKGERGSQVYKCAARLRDWGISRDTALQLVADYFGARANPPLHDGDGEHGCRHEVFSAYSHAQNSAGAHAITAQFDDVSELAASLASDADGAGAAPVTRGAQLLWPVSRESDEIDPATGEPKRIVDKYAIDNIKAHLQWTGTVLWFDAFAGERRIRSPYFGFDGGLTDDALRRVRLDAFARGLRAPETHYGEVARDIAHQAKRHPVREYLDGLRWDGTPRLAGLFSTYAGATDSELNRAAAVLLLVAAVRRVRQPGCKFDYLPVLEGPQGSGKSSFVAILAGEWGGESLSLAATDKEIIEQTAGVWIVEVAELSGMSRAESSHIKAAVTRKKDKARKAYAREAETVHRQFVAVATTNDKRYLSDTTGNRRYLPVRVEGVQFDALARDRDQLFAEAAHIEQTYGPLVLPRAVAVALAGEQRDRETVDPVREVLTEAFGDFQGFVPSSEVWRVMGYEPSKVPPKRDAHTAAVVMEDMGYKHLRGAARPRVNGERRVGYQRWEAAGTAPVYLIGGPVSASGRQSNGAGVRLVIDNGGDDDARRAVGDLLA